MSQTLHAIDSLTALHAVVEKHWGYRTFRPLQQEAMAAMLAGRDSLVVMPTGGGKSLCYQAPAVVRAQSGQGTTVVVSPLISLMKDQVDSLRANGIAAAQMDSSLSGAERDAIAKEMRQGALKMIFVSPERLAMSSFRDFLRALGIQSFAIDEAHCISHWGHDFRPEYRQLSQLKETFPGASVHAFTATATPRVRADIIEQLKLATPEVLVGNFDRPNLLYRVVSRRNEVAQAMEVLERHKDEAGIIYCIRRRDVDELTEALKKKGVKARAYHAGLTPVQRRQAQEAFAGRGKESCDLIVATVAFGMGIDRSDIRFVLHTGMPKSVEAYQQETGRAGRDGLEAECILLYSGSDAMSWRGIVEKSAKEATDAGVELDPNYVPTALKHIDDMDRYARGAACRHQALLEYFGQTYIPSVAAAAQGSAGLCGACDLCLEETKFVDDSLVLAQKILSCVARVGQRFGVVHVISVLRGENTQKIRDLNHDQLPTFGLLKNHEKTELRDFIYQLIGQKILVQDGGEYPVLRLNPLSVDVMKGQRPVRLAQSVHEKKESKRTKAEAISWEGVDRELFETLRSLRRKIAEERNVPPYVIFSDATLRELARIRPSTMERMRQIYGIGETKLRDFGDRVLHVIFAECKTRGVSLDNKPGAAPPRPYEADAPARKSAGKEKAFSMFRTGASIEDVAAAVARARSTISDYLVEYIQEDRPKTVGPWVTDRTYQRVKEAAQKAESRRLTPIFEALGKAVAYDEIRVVLAHIEVSAAPAPRQATPS